MRERRRKRYNKIINYIRLVFIIIFLLLSINLFKNTFSKYKTTAISTAGVDLAFYFVQATDVSQELQLDSILPKDDPYIYTFSVSNHHNNKRTETAIDYDIELKTTTNLPLEYEIYELGETTNLITSTTQTPDSDGTIFQYIKASGGTLGFENDEDIVYQIKVKFPSSNNDVEYQNIVEYLKLTINTRQKTN